MSDDTSFISNVSHVLLSHDQAAPPIIDGSSSPSRLSPKVVAGNSPKVSDNHTRKSLEKENVSLGPGKNLVVTSSVPEKNLTEREPKKSSPLLDPRSVGKWLIDPLDPPGGGISTPSSSSSSDSSDDDIDPRKEFLESVLRNITKDDNHTNIGLTIMSRVFLRYHDNETKMEELCQKYPLAAAKFLRLMFQNILEEDIPPNIVPKKNNIPNYDVTSSGISPSGIPPKKWSKHALFLVDEMAQRRERTVRNIVETEGEEKWSQRKQNAVEKRAKELKEEISTEEFIAKRARRVEREDNIEDLEDEELMARIKRESTI